MPDEVRGSLTVRLGSVERRTIELGARVVGLPVTTFVRHAAIAAARRQLRAPSVQVGDETVVLTEG